MIKLKKDEVLKFDEKYLSEHFEYIGTFSEVPVYDVEHAIAHFHKRFPKLDFKNYLVTLEKGIRKIKKKHGIDTVQNYMVFSRKFGLKIPIEIRPDRADRERIIGAVPTTLTKDMVYDLENEIHVFVESNNSKFKRNSICEGFSVFADEGNIYRTYEEIIVD